MPTVDNKVVQMSFKNEQFERGVRESLHSLEELKKALDLDKSAESLSNLEKIASSFDISGIAKGIEDIAGRFTLLGNLGQEAFRRISNFALDEVHKITNAITSMPQAGLAKYEQKNKSIQMIQSAMPEKSIEEIEAVLAKLNEYTDLTSYDFSTMANSIGKFVSAGVDLDVAEKVMEGIANETASAGGEISQANIAMYNFSQALAAGSVKLMDWRSIQNQNLDTKEFKEQIIETAYELGTLQKVGEKAGKTAKGTLVDFQSLPQTLNEGWFTSEVMLKVFEKYADRESDVGKKGFEAAKVAITLTQAFDAVKDAISTGWMTSFGYLFGNLEEASDLFTRVSDALIDFTAQFSEARNELLKGWHDPGKDGISGYQKVIEGLSNSWAVLMGIAEGVKRGFKAIFGELDSSGLVEASKAFADFTGKVKEFFGYTQTTETKIEKTTGKRYGMGIRAWTGELKRGMKDLPSDDPAKTKVIEMQKYLLQLKDVSVKLDKYGADGIFGPETEQAVKNFQKSVGLKETGVYDKKTRDALEKRLYPNGIEYTITKETPVTITKMGKGVKLLKGAFEGVAAVGKVVVGIASTGLQIAGKIIGMFRPIGKGALYLADGLGRLTALFVDFLSSLSLGEKALAFFDTILAPVSAALKTAGFFLYVVGNGIADIVRVIKSGVGSFEELGEKLKLDPKANLNGMKVYEVLVKIREAAEKAAPVFESLKTMVVNAFNAVKEWISGKVTSGLNSIGTFFSNLWATISEGDYLTKILTGLGTALQIIVGIIAGAGYGLYSLGKAIADGGVALFNFIKDSDTFKNFLNFISEKTQPIRDFFASVWQSLTSISGRMSEFKGFNDIWTAFMTAMRDNPLGKKFVPAIQKARSYVVDFGNKIKNLVGSVKKAFSLIKEFGDPKKALGFLSLTRDKDSNVTKILEFFEKVKNVFGGVKGAAGDAQSAVGGFFGNLIPNLKAFGQRLGEMVGGFFSIDTSGIQGLPQKLLARLQAFNPVIDWIKGKFADLKDFVMDPDKLLSHVVGALKGIGEFVINIFKNVNLGTIWDTAKTALGMYIMMTFVKSLKSFSQSFGILTGAIDKDEESGLADKLRSIAITIAILTAALAGLAFIDAGQALAGVAVMTVALGAIVGAVVALNKWAPKTGDIGQGILSMTLSIVAVIAAIAAAALLVNTGGDLTKPLLLVGGIIVALGAVAVLMSKFSKKYSGATQGTAKTILAMCAGVFLVVKAIEKMTGLLKRYEKDAALVDSAITYVAGMLVILGTVAVLMSALGKKTGSEGASSGIAPTILAMCTSLGSIVNAVAQMAELMMRYPDHFGGAYAMIEGLLITIGAIAVLLAAFSKDLDWKVSLASSAPIVAMGFFLDTIVKSLGEAIQKVSGVNPKVIEQFLIGMGEALIGLIGVVGIFSQIGVTPLLEAAVGIVAVMAAIGAGIDIVATFAADAVEKLATAMWLVGSRLADFSAFASTVDTAKIQTVIDVMTNTIVPGMANMVLNSSVIGEAVGVATNVWLFGEALGLFERSIRDITVDTGAAIKKLPEDIKATVDGINAIQGVDEAKDVLTNLGGALALYYGDLAKMTGETPTDENGNFDINKANEAFGNLADLTLDEDTIKKIQSYATGGENDLNNFAIGIENLGTALKQYGEDINGIDPDKVDTANGILDKVMDVKDHLNPIADDFNFDALKGKRQSITDFGLDIAALGGSLAKYGESVASLNPGRIIMGNVVMKTVAELNKILPETGGLWQMLKGEKSLGDFAANMSSLGDGMANYANKISGANFTNVEASMAPVKALAEAQSILQDNGGISTLITGTANLGQLGDGLVGLGEDLYNFAKASNGIKDLKDGDFTKIGQAIEPIKKLAEAQSILQNEGGWTDFLTGSSNLGNLGQGLENFASHLNTFKATVKDFDFNDEKLTAAMDLLEKTVSLQEIVQKGDDEYDFANAGRNISLLFATIADQITNNTQISDAVLTAVTSIKTIVNDNTVDQAFTWGLDLVTNLADGMKKNVDLVSGAAKIIADAISAYLHFSEPDVGPLSSMHEWMPDFLQNLASDITNNSSVVEQAVNTLSGSIAEPFKNLFGGDTNEPVISPVLDLTNIENGASQIGNILSGQSVSATTDMAKNVMSGNGVSIIQGGAAEDHSPEIIAAINELGNRIVTLETQMASQMSNLKVVMNTNALVGQIAPAMDRALGGLANKG